MSETEETVVKITVATVYAEVQGMKEQLIKLNERLPSHMEKTESDNEDRKTDIAQLRTEFESFRADHEPRVRKLEGWRNALVGTGAFLAVAVGVIGSFLANFIHP